MAPIQNYFLCNTLLYILFLYNTFFTEPSVFVSEFTYGRHHGPNKVKGAGKIPARSQCIHTDTGDVRLLIEPEKCLQVGPVKTVLLGESLEALRPLLVCL